MLVGGLSTYAVACNNAVDEHKLKLAIETLDDGHMIMLPLNFALYCRFSPVALFIFVFVRVPVSRWRFGSVWLDQEIDKRVLVYVAL